jgi:hypothetical protein
LQSALDGKQASGNYAPVSHAHTASDISDFASAVSGYAPPTTDASLLTSGTLSDSRLSANVVLINDIRLSDSRTPTAHSHSISDVTGLQTALNEKQASGSYAAGSHTHLSLDITDFSSSVSGLLPTIANSGDNRILTSTGSTVGINAESNLTFDGTNLTAPYLVSSYSSGDEGGEIQLAKPPNGTLGGGITIDAFQNKLRFFEQGGSARGFYLDLPSAKTGASENIATYSKIHQWIHSASATGIDVYPRGEAVANQTAQAGIVLYTFFTPTETMTVSSVTIGTGTIAAAGVTFARMGLYTFDESTSALTLVARTAIDTSLFSAVATAYTRSFSTTDGYPASYTLTAGIRYGSAVLVAATTLPNYVGKNTPVGIAILAPRTCGGTSSATDLAASPALGNINNHVWARFS